jgi:SAM-dependent methyltransferase
MPGDEAFDALPQALRAPLRACVSGDVPPNIAAMRLLMECGEPGEAERIIAGLLRHVPGQSHSEAAQRLQAALDLLSANPNAWRTVRSVLDDVRHDEAAGDPDEAIRRWARAFDRAAQDSPEGSVALYALGNPELLKAATAEVVDRLRDWSLLGPSRRVLDIGCGIGRFGEALAGEVKAYVGIDISGAMIEEARQRCAAFGNVSFRQSCGRDLDVFADGVFDLVLAVDSFPYMVQSGMALADTHVAEAARVLAPGGDFLVLNFSYRGDADQDGCDVSRLAQAHGFELLRVGTRAFRSWDGLAYHLVKTARSAAAGT